VKKNIQKALGTTLPVGGEQVTLFIPSKDQLGQNIDQERWTSEALATLGKLFRGATAFPPGKGVWRDDSNQGNLLFETTVMVVSYVSKKDLEDNLLNLRTFLHRFGREAQQGEVGIIISGKYYGISVYDTP
jgi:hypothetical protein